MSTLIFRFMSTVDPHIAACAKQLFVSYNNKRQLGGYDLHNETDLVRNFSVYQGDPRSVVVNSITLYLGRILSKIWSARLIEFNNEMARIDLSAAFENAISLFKFLQAYAATVPPDALEKHQLETVLKVVDNAIQGIDCLQIMMPTGFAYLLSKYTVSIICNIYKH